MATTNKYLLCAVFALALAGCAADSDIAAGDDAGKAGKGKAYVTLSLSMDNVAPATRANPTGGEAGDGYERGQSYENVVSSAVAFFFDADGVNAADATPIAGVAEFNRFTEGTGDNSPVDKIYSAEPQQVALDNGKYHVIVVANPGDDKWWNGTTLNLGQVRDHIYKEAWKVEVTKDDRGNDIYTYSDFLMASADDATLTLTSEATEEEPAEVSATVERLAARIDYNTAEETFPLVDPAYAGGTVQITGAAIVNNLTAGSYLLKRVNSTVSADGATYLGDETVGSGDVPTNYVIDPWTSQKTQGNNTFTIDGTSGRPASDLYGVWFGSQSSQTLTSELLKPGYWAALCTTGTSLDQVEGGTAGYNRIGYTLENTTADDCAGPRYSTGVVFKAKFNPADGAIANYTAGSTFFSLGGMLYASMEDMMVVVYGEGVFGGFDSNIQLMTDWADVQEWVGTLHSDDPSGYVDFLKDECADHADNMEETLTDIDKERLLWSAYMLSECGYSATQSAGGAWEVKVNQNDKDTRNALRQHGVRTYEDAQCYYTWWVRHGNDGNDDANGLMEYAIVRNNVYKLNVESVYSIGGDIPGDESLVVNVYVNDWLLLDKEVLPM